MPRGIMVETRRYHVRAVERALILLRSFLSADEGLTTSEISSRIGLDPSTAFRLLVTLESMAFVQQEPTTGRYRLGVACLELGSHFLMTNDLRASAQCAMEKLRNEFGETVHFAVLDGDEIVYLEKLPGLHPIGLMSSHVGRRAPAYCTGVGKALLACLPGQEFERLFSRRNLTKYTDNTITNFAALRAELAKIRKKQYAIDNEEHEAGVKCVAVPILGYDGVAAALSIAGPAERMEEHITKHGLVERLQGISKEIPAPMGQALGVDWFSPSRVQSPRRTYHSRKGNRKQTISTP